MGGAWRPHWLGVRARVQIHVPAVPVLARAEDVPPVAPPPAPAVMSREAALPGIVCLWSSGALCRTSKLLDSSQCKEAC